MKKPKVCCVFNYNPLYRLPIYTAMAKELDCDFFFADAGDKSIKQFDARGLKGFMGYMKAIPMNFKGQVWFSGIRKVFSLKYTHYIVTGEVSLFINWLLFVWSKLTRRKVLMWTHGEHVHYDKWTTIAVLKAFYRSADILLMYANYNRHYMTDLGCRESNMMTIHNSLDTKLQTELYRRMRRTSVYVTHFNNNYPVVVYIGRLQRRKRVEQLIMAVCLLKKKEVNLNVVLLGNMADADYLCDVVKQEGMEREVWFHGPSYDEEINAEMLYNAAVCVCPAEVGLTAIHAMSYGCPVISNNNVETQMPEFESIVEGRTGALFQENDIADLASKIERWCSMSEKQREEVRRNCREMIEREWSVDYQINVLKRAIGVESVGSYS